MLREYRDLITDLKNDDKNHNHFFNMFERHNDLDNKIENFHEHLTDLELKELKIEKLHLKDKIKNYLDEYVKNK